MATTTAPPPQPEVAASVLNLSGSSGSVVKPVPTKKLKANAAPSSAQAGLAALVATSQNAELHNAIQTVISSGSEISIVSSAERRRRCDLAQAKLEQAEQRVREVKELARAERELADARAAAAQSKLDLSAGSQASSIGRLDDVRSEGGCSTRVRRTADSGASPAQAGLPPSAAAAAAVSPFDLLCNDATARLQPTDPTTYLMGVFSSARTVHKNLQRQSTSSPL